MTSKKHFEAIAGAVTRMDLSRADRQHVALMLATVYETDNPPAAVPKGV